MALYGVARYFSGVRRNASLNWETEPSENVQLGQQTAEPTFWAYSEFLYQVRKITLVEPQQLVCPKCNGTGKVKGYVELRSQRVDSDAHPALR